MSSAELSRMVEDGLVSAEAWSAIRALDDDFLARYALTPEEAATVRNKPTPDKLASLGVPPLLAMWGSFMANPDFETSMSAGEYFTAAPYRVECADG
ncbi:hypothetical protein OQ968_05920 [Mycobacterium sp. 663a-19]|uniref:hypothetical protein n=1 Tax=Mycobacterium sp. 663a-19 TaxID=2986148 RepID=UPI002D1F3140|nr:hypothetical protein [Mycobacterium sp. 663a-19]MEB3980798.1 hypothetical protein [Mycobacterium sp. 663a-19]